eukprot:8010686-Pyramimonas_sp.AAC.1
MMKTYCFPCTRGGQHCIFDPANSAIVFVGSAKAVTESVDCRVRVIVSIIAWFVSVACEQHWRFAMP